MATRPCRLLCLAVLAGAAAACAGLLGLDEPSLAGADAGASCVGLGCASDQVLIPGLCVCIDRYEATRGGGDAAKSVAGAQPWTGATIAAASVACGTAGKRLCTDAEWLAACAGPAGRAYPYGETYDASACRGDNVGDVPVASGTMTRCEGGLPGLFDMSGNVREWSGSTDGAYVTARGGGYGDRPEDLDCAATVSFAAAVSSAAVGFRCCSAPSGT